MYKNTNKLDTSGGLHRRVMRSRLGGGFCAYFGSALSALVICFAVSLSGILIAVESQAADEIPGSAYTLSVAVDGDLNLTPFTNQMDAGYQNVVVSTTCPAGFSLLMSGKNGDNKVYRVGDQSGTAYFTSTDGTLDNLKTLNDNQWGFRMQVPGADLNETKFAGIPLTDTEIKKISSASDKMTVPVYYGVKAGADLQPGDYYGTVLYTTIPDADCYSFKVTFDTGEGTKVADKKLNFGDMLDMSTISSTLKTYRLTGWKDQFGNIYPIAGVVDINANNVAEVKLTAQWTANTFEDAYREAGMSKVPGTDYYAMQDMSGQICEDVPRPTARNGSALNADTPWITLIDTRDNNTYTVRRLADGNCWMSQDLRIVGTRNLTPADSDVKTSFSLPAASTASFPNQSDLNRAAPPDSRYGNGAYYSWYTATAGTGTRALTSGEAGSSICPRGWQLPRNSGDRSYHNLLFTTYGITSSTAGSSLMRTAPLSFNLAGYYNSTGLKSAGSYGGFWTSTATDSTDARRLYFYSNTVLPQQSYYKYNGISVRCVAREDPNDIYKINTMQEMTNTICSNTTTPNTSAVTSTRTRSVDPNMVPERVLKDTRDGNEYVVRKLADGNCWMAENLRLGTDSALILDSSDSDIASGTFELPARQTTAGIAWASSVTDAAGANRPHVFWTGNNDYGSYYNWYTAVAGSAGYNTVTIEAPNSICPKGWKLPNNTGTKSFYNLFTTAYGLPLAGMVARIMAAPFNYPLSGFYNYAGPVRNQGTGSYYWTAAASSSAQQAHHMYYGTGSITQQGQDNKVRGDTIRCVSR